MKTIIYIILILRLYACSSIHDFPSLSKSLYRTQTKQNCGIYPKLIDTHSQFLADRIDFINYENDTIYFLESFDITTSVFYRAIWTSKGKIEYKSQGNNILEYGEGYFINRLYGLIEKWDTTTIRYEENRISINGASMMFGMRVFISNSHPIAECVNFKEFFDIQKDK